jgi:hypothetical protein
MNPLREKMKHKIVVVTKLDEKGLPDYGEANLEDVYIGRCEDSKHWEIVRRDPRFKRGIGKIVILAIETSLISAYLRAWLAILLWK